MTYNPEATRSKLVEGIPFLFFLSFSSSPVTCHKTSSRSHVTFIIPVTCHIHPRSHVKNIPWSHVTFIPRSHVTFIIPVTCLIHPRLIRGRSHVTKHHPTMSHSSIIHATLFFSIKNLSFIPFFIVIHHCHCHTHSIHLD